MEAVVAEAAEERVAPVAAVDDVVAAEPANAAPSRLEEIVAEAGFPIFALRPERWSGAVALKTGYRRSHPPRGFHDVKVHYVDDFDGPREGFLVSNMTWRAWHGHGFRLGNILDFHLANFAMRFPEIADGRTSFRDDLFTEDAFANAGRCAFFIRGIGLYCVWRHKAWPLTFARLHADDSFATEVAVAGWRRHVEELADALVLVGADVARALDARMFADAASSARR